MNYDKLNGSNQQAIKAAYAALANDHIVDKVTVLALLHEIERLRAIILQLD